VGEYQPAEVITVEASPDLGSEVAYWNGTTNDSSTALINTVSMPANAHTVTVNYVITEVKDPPTNPTVNFTWQNGQEECRDIDFSWADPGWTQAPIGFLVYRDGASYGQITGMTWDLNATVANLQEIELGVRAVFVQDLEYSQTLSVTYLCSNGNMINQGEVIK
jgi:hypothetical protein